MNASPLRIRVQVERLEAGEWVNLGSAAASCDERELDQRAEWCAQQAVTLARVPYPRETRR